MKAGALDVRTIREKLNLSQNEFASKFGFWAVDALYPEVQSEDEERSGGTRTARRTGSGCVSATR